jgi:hypothetical protein
MSRDPTDDPMRPALSRMDRAPRCGAKTRAGSPCRSPAVGGKRRCRMHGGAKGSGGQPGNRNAWRHGARSACALALRRRVRELLRGARELVEEGG